MIKKYCDRCGKETDHLCNTRVPNSARKNGDYTVKDVELCVDCCHQFNKTEQAYNTLVVNNRILFFKSVFPELYKEEVTE